MDKRSNAGQNRLRPWPRWIGRPYRLPPAGWPPVEDKTGATSFGRRLVCPHPPRLSGYARSRWPRDVQPSPPAEHRPLGPCRYGPGAEIFTRTLIRLNDRGKILQDECRSAFLGATAGSSNRNARVALRRTLLQVARVGAQPAPTAKTHGSRHHHHPAPRKTPQRMRLSYRPGWYRCLPAVTMVPGAIPAGAIPTRKRRLPERSLWQGALQAQALWHDYTTGEIDDTNPTNGGFCAAPRLGARVGRRGPAEHGNQRGFLRRRCRRGLGGVD